MTRPPASSASGAVLAAIDLDRVRSDGYSFQIEMNFKAWKKGFRLREIPILFSDRRVGISKMSKRIVRERRSWCGGSASSISQDALAREPSRVPAAGGGHRRLRDAGHLRTCLGSLAREGVLGIAPVIVVDNSSSDACAAVARATPGVTLIRNAKNLGYARAVNQGLDATRAEQVLVLNPDIEVRPGRSRSSWRRWPPIPPPIAAAKLLNPDGTLALVPALLPPAAMLLRRTFLGRLFPGHRALREHLMLDWDHAELKDVDWVIGACLLARRRAVDDVGPMDERFFLFRGRRLVCPHAPSRLGGLRPGVGDGPPPPAGFTRFLARPAHASRERGALLREVEPSSTSSSAIAISCVASCSRRAT